MTNFGPPTAKICLPVWGTPTNFNRFCVLPSLLQWRRSLEANQTLHDVWPSPALVHYIYTFSGPLVPWRNFARCKIHFTSKSCILLHWQLYCTALHQRAWAKLCCVIQWMELRNFRRRHHLYSAGQPSRWASAHILVLKWFTFVSKWKNTPTQSNLSCWYRRLTNTTVLRPLHSQSVLAGTLLRTGGFWWSTVLLLHTLADGN